MKLASTSITNFRPFRKTVTVDFDNITTLIGRNDVGKSSILDALDVFFEGGRIDLDRDDPNKFSGSTEVRIVCEFSEFPETVILDTDAETSFAAEHLLNGRGRLEIHKVYDCAKSRISPAIFARALHPTADGVADLLTLKNPALKSLLKDRDIPSKDIDLRSNPALRAAIRGSFSDLKLAPTLIPLNDENTKVIWTALQTLLPTFALFQADRPSTDADAEVQDPMKVAIRATLKEITQQLDAVTNRVRTSALDVASRTIQKLREFDASLSLTLNPQFETKWDNVFKLSLTGDSDIPLNKRGSGIRRLVLLSFFRAEAERQSPAANGHSVIYAIEEPETSQHPHNQRLIVNSLLDLAEKDTAQVLLTTHNPAFAGLLPTSSVRYLRKVDGHTEVPHVERDILETVAAEIGILSDSRVLALLCVEGPNDIEHLKTISSIIHEQRPELPDLSSDPRFAWIPVGGSNLQEWVDKNYLAPLHKPELHLYDSDKPEYREKAERVNSRTDGSRALILGRRELENYLHHDAIREALEGVVVEVTAQNDVPLLVAQAVHQASDSPYTWEEIESSQRKKISAAKKRLNSVAAQRMTFERLREMDPNRDLEHWLQCAARLVEVHVDTTATV